ncbi:MAG: CDP-alcohol phosphatidyltransferase family protein [Alphaproteobacteria bacterium]|nr:CDP-alcohol phosphatidyltransferase family protein [Alphaproteobacteria bacterium]
MTKERTSTKKKTDKTVPAAEAVFRADPVLCFLEPKTSAQAMWGMSLRDRLIKQFAKEDVTEIIPVDAVAGHPGPVILLREDCVIDPPLVPVIAKRPQFALLSDVETDICPVAVHTRGEAAVSAAESMQSNQPLPDAANLIARRPSELSATFWDKLRKREVPYARAVSPENHAEAEWRIFMGTYKGATDLVTKYLWPKPAFYVTRWLAPTSITPNIVTALSGICVLLAFWLFWEGQFVAGLVFAWLMTFLDTVDGKLARTTLTSSKWGDVFDHGIDLIHPPFWYAAWALGLGAVGLAWSAGMFNVILIVLIGGYILQRVMEGIAIKALGLEIHIWRPIDTFFRLITARRNPNMVILTVVTIAFGRPDWALEAVAWWTIICLVLHGVQLVHALIVKSKEGELTSWMTKPVDTNAPS